MHKVSDPVYSNSYGLGYIYDIKDSSFGFQETWYFVRWFEESRDIPGFANKYNSKGIDTLKMFLRMKMRGEDV